MSPILNFSLGFLISYLIGAFPTAYIAGRLYKGIDIRLYGSGNVGATNAFRVLGKGPGLVVFVIDILKGILPVCLVADLLGLDQVLYRVLLGAMAVVGNNWTVFLQLKGGKGIATSLGVLIGLTIKIITIRMVLAGTMLVWAVVFFVTGFVSLASLIAAAVLPVFMLASTQTFELTSLGVVFCIFVFLRHRSNIKRLLTGQESRVNLFSKKKN